MPVTVEYVFDKRQSLAPVTRSDVSTALVDLSLHDNDVRFLKRIAISFTNIVEYTASEGTLIKAHTAILDPRDCGSFLWRRRDLMQIDAILAGDVFVEVDAMEGVSVDLDRIKAKIYRAVSRRYQGNSLFFAVGAKPVSAMTEIARR